MVPAWCSAWPASRARKIGGSGGNAVCAYSSCPRPPPNFLVLERIPRYTGHMTTRLMRPPADRSPRTMQTITIYPTVDAGTYDVYLAARMAGCTEREAIAAILTT